MELIISSDGSHTIYLPEIDETYHSKRGALTESRYVYIKEGLNQIINKNSIRVFELGLGTGLNALLAFEFALENQIKIEYFSIEKFPLKKEIWEQLNYKNFFKSPVSEFYSIIHESEWNKEIEVNTHFKFHKSNQSLENIELPDNSFDIIFYDAFAPKKQGDIWEIQKLEKVWKLLDQDAFLVTYCANGEFKRTLKKLNFRLENPKGALGKQEMTRAYKSQISI